MSSQHNKEIIVGPNEKKWVEAIGVPIAKPIVTEIAKGIVKYVFGYGLWWGKKR